MTACHALHHFAVLVSHAAGIQSDQEVFETRRHTGCSKPENRTVFFMAVLVRTNITS